MSKNINDVDSEVLELTSREILKIQKFFLNSIYCVKRGEIKMSKSSERAIKIVNERQEREVLMLQMVEAMEEEFREHEDDKEGWQNISIYHGMFKLSNHADKLAQSFIINDKIDKDEVIHMLNYLFMLYISDDKINKENDNA